MQKIILVGTDSLGAVTVKELSASFTYCGMEPVFIPEYVPKRSHTVTLERIYYPTQAEADYLEEIRWRGQKEYELRVGLKEDIENEAWFRVAQAIPSTARLVRHRAVFTRSQSTRQARKAARKRARAGRRAAR